MITARIMSSSSVSDQLRFVDITDELKGSGIQMEDVVQFVRLGSIHALKTNLCYYSQVEMGKMPSTHNDELPYDVDVYRIDTQAATFKVHRGAVEAVRQMLGLPFITADIEETAAKIEKENLDFELGRYAGKEEHGIKAFKELVKAMADLCFALQSKAQMTNNPIHKKESDKAYLAFSVLIVEKMFHEAADAARLAGLV